IIRTYVLYVKTVFSSLDEGCPIFSCIGPVSSVLAAGHSHRLRQHRIAEVDRRALNDRAGFVDHDAKPPVLGEEGQAVPAGIGADSALGKARDPARAHLF